MVEQITETHISVSINGLPFSAVHTPDGEDIGIHTPESQRSLCIMGNWGRNFRADKNEIVCRLLLAIPTFSLQY